MKIFKKIINILLYIIFLFVVFSCQQIEILEKIVFDYNQFPKIIVTSEKKIINDFYEAEIRDPYIDYSLKKSPKDHLKEWIENNFKTIGIENRLVINIIDSSLIKEEILNTDAKKYAEKTIFKFEINYLVEYVLYNDNDEILVLSKVASKRSTTSGKFISLMEMDRIIDTLIFDALFDFTNKSNELIKTYMSAYIL